MEFDKGMKYCPGLEISLPVYYHKEYKPIYSTKQNNIFKLDTQTNIHILSVQSIVQVEPEPMGLVDMDQPGGDVGHGGQGGRDHDRVRDGDRQAGQSVLHGVLGGTGDVSPDVGLLISSWEQWNAEGGGGPTELEVNTEKEEKTGF